MDTLQAISYDDYVSWGTQMLSYLKNTIIYVNYTISLVIIVPYMCLVVGDFVIYVIRIAVDLVGSAVNGQTMTAVAAATKSKAKAE